jgi:phage replication O-like protein O
MKWLNITLPSTIQQTSASRNPRLPNFAARSLYGTVVSRLARQFFQLLLLLSKRIKSETWLNQNSRYKQMSKPELEKGFTRLANELMEALCRTNLAKYESRILWTVLRKTYGYQKKMDEISLSQFSKATGIDKPNVHRTLKLLIRRRIIVSEPQVPGKIFYGLQTDYDQWMGSSLSKPIVSGETLSEEAARLLWKIEKAYSLGIPKKKLAPGGSQTEEEHAYARRYTMFWRNGRSFWT